MNRRAYLKNILILGAVGTASFSLFRWARPNQPFNPQDLLQKNDILAELAELIIPATDTPGAKAAGVQHYIINVMINCRERRDQEKFLRGIGELENYAFNKYSKPFLKCSQHEKTEVLQYAADHGEYKINILNKLNNKFLGQPFFPTLKNLTVQGYCSSELGATQGLAYDYIPGTYSACIPILKNQKSWATK